MFVIPIKNINKAEAEMNGFLRGHRVLAVKKGWNIEHRTSNVEPRTMKPSSAAHSPPIANQFYEPGATGHPHIETP